MQLEAREGGEVEGLGTAGGQPARRGSGCWLFQARPAGETLERLWPGCKVQTLEAQVTYSKPRSGTRC